jgi:hypothetical protein
MIVIFELDHDCKQGSSLQGVGIRGLRAPARRMLTEARVGIIAHHGQAKVIKQRTGYSNYNVRPLSEVIASL